VVIDLAQPYRYLAAALAQSGRIEEAKHAKRLIACPTGHIVLSGDAMNEDKKSLIRRRHIELARDALAESLLARDAADRARLQYAAAVHSWAARDAAGEEHLERLATVVRQIVATRSDKDDR
jgi:hypothetical protein